MSYGAIERSRSVGQPVNLFRFDWNENENGVLGYTDNDRIITFDDGEGAVTFQPVQAKSPSIKASGSLDRSRLQFSFPKTLPICGLFQPYPPSSVVTLRLFQGHRNDPNKDFKCVWFGRVLGVKFDGPAAVFTCEPATTSSKRVGLRRRWQIGCPHALYDVDTCKANRNAATSQWFVGGSNSDGSFTINTITMPSGFPDSGVDVQAYLAGVVWWCADRGTVIRSILDVQQDSSGAVTFLLNGPTIGLEEGMQVTTVLGCNHQEDHCLDIHDNINNFGGQSWIPNENPTAGSKNIFY